MSSFYVVDVDKRPTLEQLHKLLNENTQMIRLLSDYGNRYGTKSGVGFPNALAVHLIQQRIHRNLIVLAEASKPEYWTSESQINNSCSRPESKFAEESASSSAVPDNQVPQL